MKSVNMLDSQRLMSWPGALLVTLALVSMLSGCVVSRQRASEPKTKTITRQLAGDVTVTRFEDGRQGFVISEEVDMPGALQRDFDTAVSFLEAKEYGQAIPLLEKIVETSPKGTAPYIDLALAYRKTGKREEAEQHLKTALEMVPGHPVAGNEYGLLLRESGRFAEARQVYEQILETFPEYLPVRRNLGVLCDLYLNDVQCAVGQFELYSQARPQDELVKTWLSELRLRAGQ